MTNASSERYKNKKRKMYFNSVGFYLQNGNFYTRYLKFIQYIVDLQ